jgi:multiple sugar transport system permease protein
VLLLWFRNSIVYCGTATLITLVTCIPAGYTLAVHRFAGRRLVLSLTLVTMIIPATAMVLPLFLGMSKVHLIGTGWSVILPMAFFPFGVYLAFIYYATSLPKDLLAAARVDGCSEWQIFRHVGLPLGRPVVALVAFFCFVADWNNFFLPYVMLPTSKMFPMPNGLENLLSSTSAFNPSAGVTGLDINRPELALAALIATVPILIVLLVSQRSLVTGMLSGSSKD